MKTDRFASHCYLMNLAIITMALTVIIVAFAPSIGLSIDLRSMLAGIGALFLAVLLTPRRQLDNVKARLDYCRPSDN